MPVSTQCQVWGGLLPDHALIRKMKLSALLALDIVDGAIRGFLDSLSVQRNPHRKAAWCFAPNDLKGAYGLASRPLSNGLEALPSEILVT
jgi:hypothetical protein